MFIYEHLPYAWGTQTLTWIFSWRLDLVTPDTTCLLPSPPPENKWNAAWKGIWWALQAPRWGARIQAGSCDCRMQGLGQNTELFFSPTILKVKYSWLTVLYYFQVYNIVIQYFIQSYWLYSLCCTSMQFIHFIIGHLYLLVPTNWWIAKEDVVYHGILLSHKKEWNLAICHNMDRPGRYPT